MRTNTILFVLIFSWITGYSQTEKKAERAALKCIDETLATTDKNIKYLLASSVEFQNRISSMDVEKFEIKRKEVDSILTISGFYKSESLDINLLKGCMLSSYDLNNEKNDTASTYYQLLNHLIYLSDNPSILRELSASLHLESIKSIITTNNQDNDFYKVISFILFQGIVKEFENYATSRSGSKHISLIDTEADNGQDNQILVIVKDEVEIEEELSSTMQLASENPCGEEIFLIAMKKPQYNGGEKAIKKHLYVKQSETQGKVYVQFVIDCNGNVTNPEILRGLSPLADKVAIDLVKSMSNWTPGEQKGRKVNVRLAYPVIFE